MENIEVVDQKKCLEIVRIVDKRTGQEDRQNENVNLRFGILRLLRQNNFGKVEKCRDLQRKLGSR